jgi:hypothetical protein
MMQGEGEFEHLLQIESYLAVSDFAIGSKVTKTRFSLERSIGGRAAEGYGAREWGVDGEGRAAGDERKRSRCELLRGVGHTN